MDYQFKINDFEGPLDLLLHFVKENKMDASNFNVSLIISQYLDFIHGMEELNIDIASEYLVMASELLHLKSKIILHLEEEEEEEFELNSEEDLKNKLALYEKYKNVTEEFKTLEQKRSEVYTKVPENINNYREEKDKYNGVLDIAELLNVFLNFLDKQEFKKPLNTKITRKEYSIEERMTSIRSLLNTKKKINFKELFDIINKDYLIVTFLSVLEMTKNDEIIIEQKYNFNDITIEKR